MGQCNTVWGHEGLQRRREKTLLTRGKYALTFLGFKEPNMTAADYKVCDFFMVYGEKRLDILYELSAGRQFTLNVKLYVTKNSNMKCQALLCY